MPPPASAFQPRAALRDQLEQDRAAHATVVLTQVLSGAGGVGKSQLAASFARQARAAGVDLLVWVNATETWQLVAAYAEAAHRVQAPGAEGQDAESDARAFLDWLADTPRSWLVVLDDLTDVEGSGPWWPQPSVADNGRVLATTRRRDALVSGGGRAIVEVGLYTEAEAETYLRDRLTGAHQAHLLDHAVADLTRELGLLPLALAHAAAYMINEDVPCARYLERFRDRQAHLDQVLPVSADTEGYGRGVTASLLLSLEAAQQREPVGLAIPVMRLAARLDPAGHPQELWSTHAVGVHLTAALGGLWGEDQLGPEPALAALRLLHHYALVTSDARDGHRGVRVHALTARAARDTTPLTDSWGTIRTVANALLEIWPAEDHTDLELSAVLRANSEALDADAGDVLWEPEGYEVLYRAGNSLLAAGLYTAAIAHWQRLAADAERLLDEDDEQDVLRARSMLAYSYLEAGRIPEAITLLERVLHDMDQLLGEDHPATLDSRATLARCHRGVGRTAEAVVIEERVLAGTERRLGDEHRHTLIARSNLAISYAEEGRSAEALAIKEQVATDAVRLLGPEHPDTLTAWNNLAGSYVEDGRTTEAITILEQVAVETERLLGDQHPHTLAAVQNLATCYVRAERTTEAITLLDRHLGADHSDLPTARARLAASYWKSGLTAEAIALQEQILADCQRLLGPDHPDTMTTFFTLRGWKFIVMPPW